MKTLFNPIESKKRNTYEKLRRRFLKNLRTGNFAGKTNRNQYKTIEKLKHLESQLRIRSTSRLRHWALAAALGFVTFVSQAQTATRASFAPDTVMGGLLGERFISADFDNDSDLDLVSISMGRPYTLLLNDGVGNFADIRNIMPESLGSSAGIAIAGDLDGDGDQDIVFTGVSTDTSSYNQHLAALLNDGQGNFSSDSLFSSQYGMENLQTGDLDGDADLDIYVYSSGQVGNHYFFINEAGTFTQQTAPYLYGYDKAFLGDFDGDSDLDIVQLSNYSAQQSYFLRLSFIENTTTDPATLTFSAPVNSDLPQVSGSLSVEGAVVGDSDNDGDNDLFINSRGGGSYASILLADNDGAGNFTQGLSVQEDLDVFDKQFFAFDVDQDNDSDLLARRGYVEGNNKQPVLFINNDTAFTESQEQFAAGLPYSTGVFPGDFDGDGDVDVLSRNVMDPYSYGLSRLFLLGNEAGTFSVLDRDLGTPIYLDNPKIADLNGDGRPDVVGGQLGQVLINDGFGRMTLHQTISDSLNGGTGGLMGFADAGDIDNDGDLDLIFSGETLNYLEAGEYKILLVKNDGSGTFHFGQEITLANQVYSAMLGDVDGDGNLDIAVQYNNTGPSYIDYFVDDGNGTFVNSDMAPVGVDYSGNRNNPMTLTDIDADGDLDIIAYGGTSVAVLQSDASTAPAVVSFSLSSPYIEGQSFSLSRIAEGDIDQDGDQDIVAATQFGLYNFVLNTQVDQGITFTTTSLPKTNQSQPATDVALFDIDGDTYLDAVFAGDGYYLDEVWLNYYNSVPGSFAVDGTIASSGTHFAAGDLDGDSDTDLFSFISEAGNRVVFNQAATPPPTIEPQALVIDENLENGALVGTVIADGPVGATLTFAITQGNANNAFAIDTATGEITVSDSTQLDYETTPVFNLTVTVNDGSSDASAPVEISLNNLKDSAPVANSQTLEIPENFYSNGELIVQLTATDVDEDPLTFTLVGGNETGAFALSETGELSVNDSTTLDFEVNPGFSLSVEVRDPQQLTDTAAISVTLTDVNEAPVLLPQEMNVEENTANGAVIDTVAATDPEGNALTYTLVSGDPEGALALDAATGVLKVADSTLLNAETVQAFNLVVEVSDTAFTASSELQVFVLDSDEPPVLLSPSEINIEENAANGTVLATLEAADPEGDPVTFTLTGGNESGTFALSETGALTVSDNTAMNFESSPEFTLSIAFSDGSNADTITYNITLTDVNEQPVLPAILEMNVEENAVNGTVVGVVEAADPEGDTVTYTILAGNIGETFELDPETGTLKVADSTLLDAETTPEFALTIEAHDAELGTGAGVQVLVLDIDEAPLFEDQAFRLDELSQEGTVIGNLEATDPEGSLLTYTVTAGNDENIFALTSTGTLTLVNAGLLDYDTKADYSLEVNVTDGALTTLATISVRITTLERDRLALIELYNATGGPEWVQSANWGSSVLDNTWTGVTVEDDRLVGLALPDNGLKDGVPESFKDLTGLKNIDLSGNELRSFPDVSTFGNLENLDISDNRLAFVHIIPNLSPGQGVEVNYSPQKRYGTTLYDTLDAGSNYTVSLDFPGSGNQYQWHFGAFNGQPFNNDVQPIPGATSPSYLVEGIDFQDMGTYQAHITHPDVPGLTIISRNRNILAQSDIHGTVTDANGTPVTDGDVIVYRIADGPYIPTDSALLGSNGEYTIEGVVQGDFILSVRPSESSNILQTYYVSTSDWDQADTLQLRAQTGGIDIVGVTKPAPPTDPTGATISGVVEANFEDGPVDEEGSRISARRRVQRAGCSMRRRVRSGRPLEDEYEIIAYLETDENGEFDFTNIPDGEYLLNIQYPGIPMDETSDIYFVLGGDREQQKYSVDVLITEAGIKVDADEILSAPKPYLKEVVIYPNPTAGIMAVDYLVNRRIEDLYMELVDLQGITLKKVKIDHQPGAHRLELNLTELKVGTYVLIFKDSGDSFSREVKISRK